MTKGRPKSPAATTRGTARQSRSMEIAVPTAVTPLPAPCPDDMPAQLEPIWDAVIADLCGRPNGSAIAYRAVDVMMVRVLVEAIWTHTQATDDLRSDGITMTTERGMVVKHPAIGIQKDAASTILRYSDALGLNPSARVRLAVTEAAGMSLLATLRNQLGR